MNLSATGIRRLQLTQNRDGSPRRTDRSTPRALCCPTAVTINQSHIHAWYTGSIVNLTLRVTTPSDSWYSLITLRHTQRELNSEMPLPVKGGLRNPRCIDCGIPFRKMLYPTTLRIFFRVRNDCGILFSQRLAPVTLWTVFRFRLCAIVPAFHSKAPGGSGTRRHASVGA